MGMSSRKKNTYIVAITGQRVCRSCKSERNRQRYAEQKKRYLQRISRNDTAEDHS